MNRLLGLAVGAAILGMVSLGCGGGDNEPAALDDQPPTSGLTRLAGGGPGISISEAITSNLEGPLLINGYVVIVNGESRFCEAVDERSAQRCSGASLSIEGIDVTGIYGLDRDGEVSWSTAPIQILGDVVGEVLDASINTVA